MTLDESITILDQFTHREQDHDKIKDFNFINGAQNFDRKKIMIEETYCTLVVVTEKFLEKNTFKKILKKIDEIRITIRFRILKKH